MQGDTTQLTPTRPTERPVLRIAGALFTVVAVILVAVCGLLVVLDNNFRANAIGADGLVVGYDTKRNRQTNTYAPIVRFTTQDGQTVEFTSGIYKSDKPVAGDHVAVLYDPDKPKHAKVNDRTGRLLGPVLTGGLGAIFLLLGLLLLLLIHRRLTRARAKTLEAL